MPLAIPYRLLFWAAAAFAFAMAVHPRPPSLPGDPSDKVQHVLAFLTLTALAVRAYPRASLVAIGLGLSAFGALIEFVQLIPWLYRDGSVVDWLADTAAVALVLAVTALLRRRRRFRDSENLC
jgi:VanZ family protein